LICAVQLHCAPLYHLDCTLCFLQKYSPSCTTFPSSYSPFSSEYIILCLKPLLDWHQADIQLCIGQISKIEPIDIGIQFTPFAKFKVPVNPRCSFNFFAVLMNCVFWLRSARGKWEMVSMMLTQCLKVTISSLVWVIFSEYVI
jgi:hypothetical protein